MWKHPHGRGEDLKSGTADAGEVETPPRTWGRPAPQAEWIHDFGNTPTDVGKTLFADVLAVNREKHPHGRGEDERIRQLKQDLKETPPRTWGRHLGATGRRRQDGNTPTDVGKTTANHSAERINRKHPHGRGEDRWQRSESPQLRETPPRTWGRPADASASVYLSRNTPTDVGKTKAGNSYGTNQKKHPHGRGEDTNRLLMSPAADTRYANYADARVSITSCRPEILVIGFRGGPMVLIS